MMAFVVMILELLSYGDGKIDPVEGCVVFVSERGFVPFAVLRYGL